MKHVRNLLSLLFAGLIALPSAFSQDISTQGTEFWVSFMGNGYKTNVTYENPWVIAQVLISSKRDCSGIIENPNTGWSREFTVRANNITTISDLESEAYMETSENENVMAKGLRIRTNDTVSVFCTNIANVSFDASYVLPIQALADDYMIQSYDQSTYIGWSYEFEQYLTSAFLIVATEDSTFVDITPMVNSFTGAHPAGEEFTVFLNAGEAYQFRSTYQGNHRDLSGTRVTARDCKKIAVFNGNTLTAIPDSRTSRDLIFEQAMPLQSWGKNFVVTGSFGRNDDFVKITSSADDNIILKNSDTLTTLNAGQSYIFTLDGTVGSCFIETTYPSAVFLYNTSYDNYDESGDPSMVWIAPVEQRIDEITFTTFHDNNYADIDNHYVNIIVKTEDAASVYLDGEQVFPLLFNRVIGSEDFSYARIEIQHGVHRLACANGFNAHVYGFGHAKGYAYLVGSKATNLVTTILVNDEIIQQHDTIGNCALDPITFGAEINYQNFDVEWDFGDGTTSHELLVTHTYTTHELFVVTLTVISEETPCESSSATTQTFYIDARHEQDVHYYDEACIGQLYSGYGFDNIVIQCDTTLVREEVSVINPECNHFVYLAIDAYHVTDTTIHASTCFNGPSVYSEHGFNIPYNEPGTYEDAITIPSPHGCDSTVHLILEVGDFYEADPDIIKLCYDDSHPAAYTWIDGVTYNTDTYITKTLPYGDCEGIFTLDLSFVNSQPIDLYETICDTYDWEISGQVYHFDSAGVYSHFDDLSPYPCQRETRLHLAMSYSPAPKIGCDNSNAVIFGDTIAVVTNTEFFSFQYDFFIEDTLGHIGNWESCEWHISKPSWMIEPFTNEEQPDKRFCRVYVAERSDSLIMLTAKVLNRCDTITAVFYLKSSFLDIDEQNTVRPDFSIVPNPNKGDMELHFEHLTGKVNIKIYDIHGSLFDDFDTYNYSESNTLRYTSESCSKGIYLFVATAKEGTLIRRVVITQ